MAQLQQLYVLQKKARLIKGKKTPESSRAFEARLAMLEAKTDNAAMRAYLQMKSLKLLVEAIQPLTEREVAELHRYLMVRALERGQSAQCAEKYLC